MSENFESTYESTIPSDNPVFINSGLKGGDDGISLSEFNKWDENYPETLNIGNYLTNNSPDTIYFQNTTTTTLFGNDHLTINPSFDNVSNNMTKNVIRESSNGFWKYEEDLTLKEIQDYISETYRSHYTSQDSKTQTLDLIESIGDGEAFCRSNAIKYLSRFGKKNGKSKMDILKAIHYCILLYHFAGLHKNNISDFPY